MAGLPQPLPVLMPPLLLLVVASLAGVRGNLESSAASQPETMDETVVVGGTVKLSCTVEEPDNSSLQWSNPQQQTLYFGEKRALRDNRIQLVKSTPKELTISISNILMADEGEYTCSIFTMPVRTAKALVTVLGVPQKPEIIGYDGPFKENQKVTLTCKTFGSKPAAQLSWYKGPEKLEGAKSEVSEDANKKTFTVRSQIEFLVSQKDNGVEIVCAVEPQSHLNGDSSTSLKIEVLYSPTARIDAYPQIPREGEKLRLQCDGSGNPTPHTYAWEKEDGELPPQTKEEENSLVFLFLNRSDSGSYLCKASNTLGTFVAKYRLEVNDPSPVPSTSTIDHAVIGCVVAVIVFLLLCLIIVLGRYLIRHKGTYLTHEAKGADDAPDADTAIINAEASQAGGDDKKEYFI
ncbi:cell adhesion molecule 3 isoform X2 [Rhinatrema bivittatum]|uniref:cell adhesion molecule 3 isoform X2 n=1 Tax=Rhinatrema bivittatum TaxID=194408 RepID=UPI001128D0CB|nr:cell adhesion molecule 3 isoform X2 [Rhinatrema bivittatum]